MIKSRYLAYISQFGEIEKRSMFGGTGLFQRNAMFALLVHERLFIRGGGELDNELLSLQCEKYRHVKRQTTATVNYYDVTSLFDNGDVRLNELVRSAIEYAVASRVHSQQSGIRRLRDMPNMHLTLERMVKKAGVCDVDTFIALGAPKVFTKVRNIYGHDLDVSLLWKFAGAIEGVHWELIQEPRKRQLLDSCYEH